MPRLLSLLLFLALVAPPDVAAKGYAPSNAKIQRTVERANYRHPQLRIIPAGRWRGDLRTMLLALAKRHRYTVGHSLRVAGYVEATARELGASQADAARYARAAMVHDIGKLKIPLGILEDKKKRSDKGKTALTKKQFRVVKRHPAFGVELLNTALSARYRDYGLMRDAILFHHERIDAKGAGQFRGREVPFIARLIAVADVYDSLTSKRSYRDPVSPKKALAIIEEGVGTQFDPRLVRAFRATLKKHGYRRIAPQTKSRSLMDLPAASPVDRAAIRP